MRDEKDCTDHKFHNIKRQERENNHARASASTMGNLSLCPHRAVGSIPASFRKAIARQ